MSEIAKNKLNLKEKIIACQWSNLEIKKSGKNTSQGGYNYKNFTDIKRAMESKLKEYNISIIFKGMIDDTFEAIKEGAMTRIFYLGRFIITDGNEIEELNFPITASNTDVAKAHGSAITYALKYVFNAVFLIPDETLDPDHDKQNVVKENNAKVDDSSSHVKKRSFKEAVERLLKEDDDARKELMEQFECAPEFLLENILNSGDKTKATIARDYLRFLKD